MPSSLKTAIAAAVFGCLAAATTAEAGTLSVSPTLIDQKAPASTAALTVQAPGKEPMRVQVRLFRWVQVDGQDRLEPTRDVVASPPMLKVAPGTDYTVRIVRTTKRPVTGEESYRLLVDQLPEPKDKKANQVTLVIRHSIPVFFSTGDEKPAAIAWSAVKTSKGLVLTARNDGGRRFKLTNLVVKTASGKLLRRIDGLAGYVLGRSTMSWPVTGQVAPGSALDIAGQGEGEPFHGTSLVKPSP
ncbi:molecular chaperone [Aestuariivirga sp. YIM B02566]|uniref:Molecular chaperone n=1 Tax=Taklimakanibacter albus TaxID=2800327 RepID=A0ACC5RBD6_9HYPH|nr:molecular chaperone [Aestuariivirga sp. YIM B02566]MBK1870001.1 molecular chaperone [Aestuariivirga sp. YIM B02566]